MSEEVKMQIVDSEASSMSMMKQLADNDPSNDVIDINGEQLVNRTKLFLVAQARNSLNRIIRLTSFMEKLETQFMDAVANRLESEPESISTISLAMETVSKCLEDANATVMQIMKDEKLQQIVINTTNIITPDGGSATVIDARSRDEIRNLASSLLSQLTKMSENSDNVVDVEEGETANV